MDPRERKRREEAERRKREDAKRRDSGTESGTGNSIAEDLISGLTDFANSLSSDTSLPPSPSSDSGGADSFGGCDSGGCGGFGD